MKSRKQRRLEAKINGVAFEPQYIGNSPIAFEEYSGVGYERFNNKFVTIKEIKLSNDTEYVMGVDIAKGEEKDSTGLLKRLSRLWSRK